MLKTLTIEITAQQAQEIADLLFQVGCNGAVRAEIGVLACGNAVLLANGLRRRIQVEGAHWEARESQWAQLEGARA